VFSPSALNTRGLIWEDSLHRRAPIAWGLFSPGKQRSEVVGLIFLSWKGSLFVHIVLRALELVGLERGARVSRRAPLPGF
jgi:hypothetical protein